MTKTLFAAALLIPACTFEPPAAEVQVEGTPADVTCDVDCPDVTCPEVPSCPACPEPRVVFTRNVQTALSDPEQTYAGFNVADGIPERTSCVVRDGSTDRLNWDFTDCCPQGFHVYGLEGTVNAARVICVQGTPE